MCAAFVIETKDVAARDKGPDPAGCRYRQVSMAETDHTNAATSAHPNLPSAFGIAPVERLPLYRSNVKNNMTG
jgi:hypothetical protein